MKNKIFLKIGLVLASVAITYVLFIIFIISPNITKYLTELETKHALSQLSRIESVIKSKEQYLKEFKNLSVNKHKETIRNTSFMAYAVINNYYKMYQRGTISKEDALSHFVDIVSNVEYGYKDDYLFILDTKGKLIFHPEKEYHNKNISMTPDANGRLFVEEIITKSMKNGEAYTKHTWSKLNSNYISEKIVHSIYFKPFDLIISSGVYVDNIKEELELEKDKVVSELRPLSKSIVLGKEGYVVIMTGENRIVIHPNQKIINKDFSNVKEPGSATSLVQNLKNAFKENRTWYYKWNKLDDTKNYVYNKIGWIKYNEFFDWYIIATLYKKDLESKAIEFNNLIINSSIVILLVLVSIGMLFIRKLLFPIKILANNANLVSTGQLNIRNNIESNDELGSLANHFDSMLDKIERNTKNLELEVEKRTAELQHKLYYDALTGIKNRESLLKDLNGKDYCALTLIDIEGFDDINELYGYNVGNDILIQVKEKLERFIKKSDINLYRLNSDIFALVDYDMSSFISYDRFLDSVQEVFTEEFYIKTLGMDIFLYVTTGTSISQNDSLKSARIALKKAKHSNVKYIVYNKEIDTQENIKKTMYWREKIKKAIEEDRVIPFYQPIFNYKEIIKYEALMRIYDNEDGKAFYLSPGAFFDIAIKTKQYFKLNQIVIQKTLNNIDKLGKDVSLNISFADILNREFNLFIEYEINKLKESQRERVIFEILESDNISDYDVLDKFIFKYREKGVRIAIDDFGTGYSNFAHILRIKPDYIKIDGSLIKDINTNNDSYEMVKSIIAFSKAMKIKTIAEFIHSEDVYVILKKLNVDEFQGFYLGEPEPLVE